MAKKNLQKIAADLQPAAEHLPTQHVQPVATPKPDTPTEPLVQFSFGLRKSQRKELARLAADADMTVRAFILDALTGKGLQVSDEDLKDKRRSE
jgi:hypothetical protein